MKKNYIYKYLLSLFVIFGVCNQNVFAVNSFVSTSKNYELLNNLNSNIIKIENTSDGGFITISNETNSVTSIDGIVKKYNSNKTVEWETTIGGSLSDKLTSVVTLKNGGYLISGYSDSKDGDLISSTGSRADGFIVRLNEKGEKDLVKVYSGTGRDRIDAVIEDKDGNYILGFFSDSKESKNVQSGISNVSNLKKTDTNGEVISEIGASLNTSYDIERYISHIGQVKDGSYVYFVSHVDQSTQLYVYKTDVAFTKIDHGGVGFLYNTQTKFYEDNNKNLISIIGSSATTPDTPRINSFNYESKTITVTALTNYFPNKTHLSDLIKNPEGGYIAVGYTSNVPSLNLKGQDAIIVYIAEDFSITKVVQFSGNGTDKFDKVSLLGDELIISGYSSETINIGGADVVGNFIVSYNESGYEKSFAPTTNQLDNGELEIIDNNPVETRNYIEYNMNDTGWVKYQKPFKPVYSSPGEFSLSIRAVTLNNITSPLMSLSDKDIKVELNSTADLSFIFKQIDTIELTLSDNTIEFGEVNGLIDIESTKAIIVTISSSLPFNLSIHALDDFKGENENNTLDAENLQVRVNDLDYKSLKKTEVVLIKDEAFGINKIYNLTFKLKSASGVSKDKYKINTELKVYQN